MGSKEFWGSLTIFILLFGGIYMWATRATARDDAAAEALFSSPYPTDSQNRVVNEAGTKPGVRVGNTSIGPSGALAVPMHVDKDREYHHSELLIVRPDGRAVRVPGICSPASWGANGYSLVAHTDAHQLVRIKIDRETNRASVTQLGVKGLFPEMSDCGLIAYRDPETGHVKVLIEGTSKYVFQDPETGQTKTLGGEPRRVIDVSEALHVIDGDVDHLGWDASPSGHLNVDIRTPRGEVVHYTYLPWGERPPD